MLRSLLKFSLLCSIFLLVSSNTSEAQVRAGQGAIDVNCTQGCSGGTTDVDDGTVAGGQSTGIGINFLYLWDGANWKRGTGTAAGGLNVICTSGCGSPPASADNTAFVAGTTNVSNSGFVFNSSIAALTSGSYGAARVSANRVQLHINWDAAGNERGANVNASNQLSISCDNGCGSVTANAGTNLNTSLLVLDSTITGRLPAGSTPANGESNALTTSRLGSYNFIYNGATWDRWTGAVAQSGTWNIATLTGISNVVHIDDNAGSLTVDGSVTTVPPSNASTNVTQFGSTNISTGTGVSGAGIPRVTISNDSSLAANQSVDISRLAGTATSVNNGAVDAGTLRVTLANNSTGIVSLTTGAATIGALTANQSVNLNQVNGIAVTTGVGASGTGSQRVVTATDSTIGTVSLNSDVRQATAANLNATVVGNVASGSVDSGNPQKIAGVFNTTQPTFTDGQRGNVQISPRGALYITNGTESLSVICTSGCTPGGSFADNSTFTLNTSAVNNTGYLFNDSSNALITTNNAGVARMSAFRIPYTDLSKDQSNLLAYLAIDARADAAALGKAGSDKVAYYLRAGLAGGIVTQQNPLPVTLPDAPDPCSKRKGNVAISQTATTRLISGKPGQLIAICYSRVVNATAEIINELEGTGTNCGTSTLAISGSTTAANGESFAANGGFSAGEGGFTVSTTNIPGNDYCLGQSGTARVSGHVTYVYYQP